MKNKNPLFFQLLWIMQVKSKYLMVKFIIFSAVSLVVAILLFSIYNSGTGSPLGSWKKRTLFIIAFISFCAFIFFLTKAYYYSENKRNEKITQELVKEYNNLERLICINVTSNLALQDKQAKVNSLIKQLVKRSHNEYDIYFYILINVLSALIGWIIVFTFRNKIIFWLYMKKHFRNLGASFGASISTKSVQIPVIFYNYSTTT